MSFKDNYFKETDTICDNCNSSNCVEEEFYKYFEDTRTFPEHTTKVTSCYDCSFVEYYDFDKCEEVSEFSNLKNVNLFRECRDMTFLTQEQLDMNINLSDLKHQYTMLFHDSDSCFDDFSDYVINIFLKDIKKYYFSSEMN